MALILNEAAKDGLIANKNSKAVVASQINLNLQGEYDAIDGYEKLITWFEKYNDQDAIDHIREIISDEKNHSKLLREIALRYDGNIPTAKD